MESLQSPGPKKTHLTVLSVSMAEPSLSSAPEGFFASRKPAPHRSSFASVSDQVQKHLQDFHLSKKQLVRIKDNMQAALEKGLKQKDGRRADALPMLPTYVCVLPDGTGKCILQGSS